MAGHGWVVANKDGSVARCGGPGVCKVCQDEQQAMTTPTTSRVSDIAASDLVFEAWPPDPGGMRVYAPRGVKVTHTPTGFTCACSHERSGHANRDTAMRALHAALASLDDVVAVSELEELADSWVNGGWRTGANYVNALQECADQLRAILNRGGK